MIVVRSSSKDKCALAISLRRHRFVDWISLSKAPPHQGACSTLSVHSQPIPARCSLTVWSSNMALIYLDAALRVFPLSDTNLRGRPLCEANFFTHLRKEWVDMSVTTSKCTARVTRHVNKQIHTFFEWVALSTRIVNGPAKSTPE